MAEAFCTGDADLSMCGHSPHGIERVWRGRRYLCIRAVGQMRDGDPQPGYSIEENGRYFYYRIPCGVEQVVHDPDGMGLEEGFKARWASFLQTAYDPEWSRL